MSNLLDWLVEHEPTFRKSRLPSLYSDLSVQKTTNPEGYAANVLAWQSALVRAASAGKLPNDSRLVLQSAEELLDVLASSQYGRPSGLGLVLDESIKSRKMFEMKEFENTEQSIYHRAWIPSPWTVLRWGLKQTGLTGNSSYDKSGRLQSGQLVLVPALEDLYKQISTEQAQHGSTLTDRIMSRKDFEDHFGRLDGKPLSKQDTELLLQYLSRDKELLSYDSKTVKFKSSSNESPEPISSEDRAVADLKSLMSSLESQVARLKTRIATLQKEAKTAVESKNKNAALSALRSKKLAEATLQQRTDTLTQLEEVFTKIEQAIDQVQIVEVMQSSASVLKGLNKKIGGVERVEDVVEELREEMGKVDEVGQVLQEPLDNKTILDEAEVDDELEEMEKEERRKEEEREAEATRKRLAELEALEKHRAAEQTKQTKEAEEAEERKRQQAADDEKLNSSIEQLNKMQITEGNVSKTTTEDNAQSQQQERVPEPAS